MEKILKCMQLAADPAATEGERNAAQFAAEKLMLKWQISSLEMRSKEPKPQKATDQVKDTFEDLFDKEADWEIHLGSGIARCFNSKIIVHNHRSSLRFFGSKDDLEMIDYFFSRLRLEIGSWAEEAYPKGIRKQRAYAYGMVCRVNERLEDLYKKVNDALDNTCRDLVVISKALVQAKINEVYPKLGKMRPRSVGDNSALARGYADGNNLNLASGRSRISAN